MYTYVNTSSDRTPALDCTTRPIASAFDPLYLVISVRPLSAPYPHPIA